MVKKCFLSLFKAVLKLCVSKGMIRGKRQAVDSVLYQSQCFYGQFGREEKYWKMPVPL
jgi:hypothetical protein